MKTRENPTVRLNRELLDRIESLSRELGARTMRIGELETALADAQKSAIPPQSMPYQYIEALIRAVVAGQKINAIREVRALLNLGLKESKELVERAGMLPPPSA